VARACGVVFERWVTPEQADADLLRIAALAVDDDFTGG